MSLLSLSGSHGFEGRRGRERGEARLVRTAEAVAVGSEIEKFPGSDFVGIPPR